MRQNYNYQDLKRNLINHKHHVNAFKIYAKRLYKNMIHSALYPINDPHF